MLNLITNLNKKKIVSKNRLVDDGEDNRVLLINDDEKGEIFY